MTKTIKGAKATSGRTEPVKGKTGRTPKAALSKLVPRDVSEITAPQNTEPVSKVASAPRQTKAALICASLEQDGGATLATLMELTGWQAHTVRAALSGLRKSGVTISRRRDGDQTIYAIIKGEAAEAQLGQVDHPQGVLVPSAAEGRQALAGQGSDSPAEPATTDRGLS